MILHSRVADKYFELSLNVLYQAQFRTTKTIKMIGHHHLCLYLCIMGEVEMANTYLSVSVVKKSDKKAVPVAVNHVLEGVLSRTDNRTGYAYKNLKATP